LQLDDAEQIIRGQELSLGYSTPQPPLYTWISWIAMKLFDESLLVISSLKYLMIFFTFIFIYKTGELLFSRKDTNTFLVMSFLLLPSFGWHMHQGFTNTILLGLGISMTFYYLLKIQIEPKKLNYIFLGCSFAIGMLGKYSFIIFLTLILLSSLSVQSFRNLILNKRFLLSLVVFFLLISPHFLWLIDNYQLIFNQIDGKLKIDSGSVFLEKINSLFSFLKAAIGFILPLLISLIFFGKKFFSINTSNSSDELKLLYRFFAIAFISATILSIFYSMPHFKMRWFHPIMMIFPFLPFLIIDYFKIDISVGKKFFIIIFIFFTLLSAIARVFQMSIGPDMGFYGRINRPIVQSIKTIENINFSDAIIKTEDHFLGVHLLITKQENPILIRKKIFRKELSENITKCIWLWDNDTEQKEPILDTDIEIKNIKTKTGEIDYILHYALLKVEKC